MRLLVFGGFACLLGCGDRAAPAARFRVARIEPDPRAGPLRLNRELEIQFSGPVDPASVTADSIQVLDADGRRAEGTFELSDFVVKFWPRPPVTAALDDGTWRPGARYTLRILGFPSPNAVRQQRTSAYLPDTLSVPLTVVDLRAGEMPFLPEDRTPFLLLEPYPVRVAADGRRLIVRMSKPPDPRTLSCASFSIHDPESRVLPIRSWTIHSGKYLDDTTRACRVDLELGEPVRGFGARHWLVLGEASRVPRDYGGEPLSMIPLRKGLIDFALQPEAGDGLLREEFDDPTHGEDPLTGVDEADGVMAWCGGQLRPFVLAAAGTGRLGVFAPRRDTVLEPGVPFDPGHGETVVAPDGDFQFAAIRVPEGVRVTLRGTRPLLIRSQRGIHIAGTLQVATPPARVAESRPAAGRLETWLYDRVQRAAAAGGGAFLITSGSVATPGRVVVEPGAAPLCVAAAGALPDAATWPAGTELVRVRPTGAPAELKTGQSGVEAEPDPRPVLHERFRVSATSTWQRLSRVSPRQLRLAYGPDQVDARIRVSCRVAGADPLHPDRPHDSVAGEFMPGPLLQVPDGACFAQLRVVIDLPPGPCGQLPLVEWVRLDP